MPVHQKLPSGLAGDGEELKRRRYQWQDQRANKARQPLRQQPVGKIRHSANQKGTDSHRNEEHR